MSDQYLGEIRMFGGNFAPVGWALCNGQLLSISQNAALFSILGTTFGGDGVQNFGLPDLRGRAPLHWGQGTGLSNYVLGEQTGTENVTLLQNQMPMHTHQVQASTTNGSSSTAQNAVPATAAPARGQSSGPDIYGTAVNTTMNPQMISASGGSQPHENMQPSLCVSFIIALQGIYPSRS
jgi:microcystin-dependent protein